MPWPKKIPTGEISEEKFFELFNHEEYEKEAKIPSGGLWEYDPVIYYNCLVDMRYASDCKHLRPGPTVIGENVIDKSRIVSKYKICPIVVVGTNEGGHCTTGVCYHCVKEYVEALKKGRP